jgi:hypothetical protein
VAAFIAKLEQDEPPRKNFVEILDEIEAQQQEEESQTVAYPGLQVGLRLRKHIRIEQSDLFEACKALESLSGGLVHAYPGHVELSQSPSFIVNVIAGTIRAYPEEMRQIASEVLPLSSKAQAPAKRKKAKRKRTAAAKPTRRTKARTR